MQHDSKPEPLFGGIEAGGTKWVCAVGRGAAEPIDQTRFPTTSPAETLDRTIAFFAPYRVRGDLAAIGVGSFGPVDLDPASPTWGSITTTPKPGWAYADVAGRIKAGLDVPIAFDTDVNTAMIGEARWGAAQGCTTAVYITVGTGIGGGVLAEGRLLHGLIHPEIGHIRLPRDPERDPFRGSCPFHGDCLEGLASGPALAARWGRPAETLPPDHPAWPLEAHYLALALVSLICTLSPQRIVLGGGVMEQQGLFPLLRAEVQALLGGYVQSPAILEHIDEYIVPPALPGRSGVVGALALAEAVAGDRVTR
jgi:fructokinase